MESRVPRTDQPELGPFGEVPNIECFEYREFKDSGGMAALDLPFNLAGVVLRIASVEIRDPFHNINMAMVSLPSEVSLRGSDASHFLSQVILRAVYRHDFDDAGAEHLVKHDPPSSNTEERIRLGLRPSIDCMEYRPFARGDHGMARVYIQFDRADLRLEIEDVYIRDPNRDLSETYVRLPDCVTALRPDGKRRFDEAVVDAIRDYCEGNGINGIR